MRSLHVGRDDKMRSLHALRLVEMTIGGRRLKKEKDTGLFGRY